MSEPDGRLNIIADDDFPRVSDNLDLPAAENVRQRRVATFRPVRRRRAAAHLTNHRRRKIETFFCRKKPL